MALHTLLSDTQKMHAREIQKKKLAFSIDCPKSLTCKTDASLLKAVLGNLISNAVKYTPQAGTISVRALTSEGKVRMTVEDNGCGIPHADQARVFTRFFRAENAKLMKADGTGLGLYLVQSIVKLLGGTVTFTSREKKGTMFVVELPVSPSVDTSTPSGPLS